MTRSEPKIVMTIVDADPRELQVQWIKANFAMRLACSLDELTVVYDDDAETIAVEHCLHVVAGSCSPYPYRWVMHIHSDDDEYRFWDAACHLMCFPFQDDC